MVSVSRRRTRVAPRRRGGAVETEKIGAVIGIGLVAAYLILSTVTKSPLPLKQRFRQPDHPVLHVNDSNSELFDNLAYDIQQTLNCTGLFNHTNEYTSGERRRLLEGDNGFAIIDDDYTPLDGGGSYDDWPDARHLFCLAALNNDKWQSRIACPASTTFRKALLELWGMARAELEDPELMEVLKQSTESTQKVVDEDLKLWMPSQDHGIDFIMDQLKEETTADFGGFHGLSNLGPGKVFVDVGSGMGVISMAIALLYPGTKIVSIEAAAPNWLLQEMNWRCNSVPRPSTVLLGGVGPSHTGTQVARFVWRPFSTTSTRAWSPLSEKDSSDMEIKVKLRPWESILAEAGITNMDIDVLNLDCEGCEYNLIPNLSPQDCDSFRTIMGAIHWGYIPDNKKPSSARAAKTHERLCRHENYARTAKECCAFPDMAVLSSVEGEILVQDSANAFPKQGTVRDVAGSLCDDFESWRVKAKLDDIDSDWGWFRLTSRAN